MSLAMFFTNLFISSETASVSDLAKRFIDLKFLAFFQSSAFILAPALKTLSTQFLTPSYSPTDKTASPYFLKAFNNWGLLFKANSSTDLNTFITALSANFKVVAPALVVVLNNKFKVDIFLVVVAIASKVEAAFLNSPTVKAFSISSKALIMLFPKSDLTAAPIVFFSPTTLIAFTAPTTLSMSFNVEVALEAVWTAFKPILTAALAPPVKALAPHKAASIGSKKMSKAKPATSTKLKDFNQDSPGFKSSIVTSLKGIPVCCKSCLPVVKVSPVKPW